MMMRKLFLGLTAAAAGVCLYAQQGAVRPRSNTRFNTPQEAASYYENLVGRLASQVQSMQDENAMLTASNAELKQRVARLEQDVRSLSNDVAALRKQIAADAEVRKNQLNNLASKITESTRQEKKAPVMPKLVPQQTDNTEYVEHVVEKGTTLNALAKAYHVSVNDIKKANKLKNNNIYQGQKLLIPVSSKR
jgi:LysM repeat protein